MPTGFQFVINLLPFIGSLSGGTTFVNELPPKTFYIMGSLTDDGKDKTGGVTAYSTIYWTTSTIGGINYYDLTKVTGGWSVLSGYTLSNKKVVIQQNGYYYGGYTSSQSITKYPSLMTFDYLVPSTWYGIAQGTVGSNQYTKITRSSSTWDFWFENFILKDS